MCESLKEFWELILQKSETSYYKNPKRLLRVLSEIYLTWTKKEHNRVL